MKTGPFFWSICLAATFLSLPHCVGAPANDDFTNATILTGFPVTAAGDTTGATAEPGEPSVGLPPHESIWWKWTAPFTGRIAIINDGPDLSAWLKVFTGSDLLSLSNLISNDLYLLNVLNVQAGTTYSISVDINGPADAAGPVGFRLAALAPNDNFADAIPISGEMVETFGDNTFATLEPGEPDYSAGWQINSVWWSWTAPSNGPVRISAVGSSFWAFFDILTGDSLTDLTLVTMGDSRNDVTLNAVAGTVYHIRVVGSNTYGTGGVRLAIYPSVPPNDDFESRTVLEGTAWNLMGTTIGATAQSKDPVIFGSAQGRTVWYSWTALANGQLAVAATNLTGNPLIPRFVVGVFEGTNLSKLRKLAAGQDSTSLSVSNGQTYIIGVDGDAGDFRLASSFIYPPPNDNFSNRLTLSGSLVAVTNDNSAATFEPHEPVPAKGVSRASMWYQWTATANGFARIVAAANGFVPVIAVYEGTAIQSLKRVTTSLNMVDTPTVFCDFQAVAGTTYVFSVDGLNGGRGMVTVGVDFTTFRLTSPTANAFVSAASPPLFQVSVPARSVDGRLVGVSYVTVEPNGQIIVVGSSSEPPFSVTPTNLSPGRMTLYALGTNGSGVVRVSPPVLIKVRPVNDDFAQALPLDGYEWQASGYTAQASRQSGEPGSAGATVWWVWLAPSTGQATISTQLGDAGPLSKRTVTVYTGPDLRHLTRVPWTTAHPKDSQNLHFNVVGDQTYHIVVGAVSPDLDPGTWPFLLQGRLDSLAFNAPTNSVFSEPTNLPVGIATTEDPPAIQRVDFLASDGYTNNQLLATVTAPPYSFTWTNAPPGNYTLEAQVVKVAGPNPPSALLSISVRPMNDAFSNRIVLHTNFSWMSHRITGATREPGEPDHNGDPNADSAWWTWTPPTTGIVYVSDPTGLTSAGLALYTGTNLLSLTPVPTHPDPVYQLGHVAELAGGIPCQFAVIPGSTPNVNFQLRFYPPPPNDDFSNRITVSGSLAELDSYTVGATREPNEPALAGFTADHTVWWSWTAPGPGVVTLQQTAGLWVIAGVYTGDSLASLQNVASSGSLITPLNFEVTSNTTYQIALMTYWGDEEHVGADLEFTTTASNDWFTARASLNGTNFSFVAYNAGATVEPGEPPLAPGGSGRTIWWSWTAPSDGAFYLRAQTSATLPHGTVMLDAYQGDSLATLQLLAGGGDQFSFHAASNQTYQIRFDSAGLLPQGEPIQLVFIPAPPNDDFVNATVLQGLDISTNGTLRGASPETNDPPVWPGASNTVWYSWTAPQSGSVIAALTNITDFYAIQVFTGSNLAGLTPAGISNQADSVLLEAQAWTTYYFAVAGFPLWEPDWPGIGSFQLLLMPGGQPANDDFVNPTVLTGSSDLKSLDPVVLSLKALPQGRFALHLQGKRGTIYRLEYSNDLRQWQNLRTGVLTSDEEELVDPESGAAPARFYRLR